MQNEKRDRDRLKHALQFDGQGNKPAVLVPWKPTHHHPEKHATAIEQAHGNKRARDERGRYAKSGLNSPEATVAD